MVWTLLAAGLSGTALAVAFPPFGLSWCVWVGLVPLLWAIQRSGRIVGAFLCGCVAGVVFWAVVLDPLTSSHVWTGWATSEQDDLVGARSRQWWFLQALRGLLAIWCGLFWGTFAAIVKRLARPLTTSARAVQFVVLTPALWIVLCEWLHRATVWGFQWGVLGNALADSARVRQLASLGGIWLLSGLAVAVNAAIFSSVALRRDGKYWIAPLVVGMIVAASLATGEILLRRIHVKGSTVRAAALQYHKDKYTQRDFLTSGLDRSYATLIEQSVTRGLDLLVLPESIALGTVRLDGSWTDSKPRKMQVDMRAWMDFLRPILTENPTILTVGLDTVEDGNAHNTLVTWTAGGPVGWYHKRRLVPFAEYQPRLWGAVASRGRSQYSPGFDAGIVRAGDLALGGFICQEVQFPGVIRASVRAGANLLVSGGNDGVFADPAVAEIHADMARIRAVESGRYVVRAMKTGISAIIDPAGRELRRSLGAEGVLLEEDVATLDHRTLYVRAGEWVIWAALLVIALAGVTPRIAAARHARSERTNGGSSGRARPEPRRRRDRGRRA